MFSHASQYFMCLISCLCDKLQRPACLDPQALWLEWKSFALLDQVQALFLLVESIIADRRFERRQRMIDNQRTWQSPTVPCDHTPIGASTESAAMRIPTIIMLRTSIDAHVTGGAKLIAFYHPDEPDDELGYILSQRCSIDSCLTGLDPPFCAALPSPHM